MAGEALEEIIFLPLPRIMAHQAMLSLFPGVTGEPDVMAEEEVECYECHDLSGQLSIAAIQETCVDCHEAFRR